MTPYHEVLQRTLDHALDHLQSLDAAPVGASASLQELRARFAHPLNTQPIAPVEVIDELIADTSGGLLGSAGGRFFAWVIGGHVPAALAADWLVSTWDQNAAIHACSPAAAVIEEVAGAWLKSLLGLPSSAGFAFTTGCQMAHLTALAAARHATLARHGWNVERRGLGAAPPLQILTSRQRHGSIERAVRLLGVGSDQLVDLPVDAQGRLLPPALRDALAARRGQPSIVVLQAGDLNIGAYDPFDVLIPIARERGAWVHVDGAFGLWAAASDRFSHLLAGHAGADSWATDGHKWLNLPFDSGFVFIADSEAHRGAMSYRASYAQPTGEARDQIDWNPEWSRRARAVPAYAAMRQLGRQGIAALIERCCDHAHALVERIGALPGAQVVWAPVINQGLLRFASPRHGAGAAEHDAFTDAVIAAVNAGGEAFFSGTTWNGLRCMRVSVVNWQTDEGDVERAVEAVRLALLQLRTG